MPPAAKLPERWKHLYTARNGYANYRFNQERRDECLAGLRNLGSVAQWKGLWQITGETDQKLHFEFKLGSTGAGLILGKDQFYQSFLDGDEWKDEPPGSGALLGAFRHLQLLLMEGSEKFTESCYWGSEEWGDTPALCDVVRCDLASTVSYWYFRRPDRAWTGMRFHLTEDAAPCEITCEAPGMFGNRRFPAEMNVRGPNPYQLRLVVKSVTVGEKAATPPTEDRPDSGKERKGDNVPSD
ncbi:MAG: hypothetical protein U0903_07625 [Planctomycetales bacterium]